MYLLLASYLAIAGVFFVWTSVRVQGVTLTQTEQQKIQDALAEAACPRSNNSTSINAAAANLDAFIYARSGINLSSVNRTALTSSEQYSWTNNKTLAPADLEEIMVATANDKLVTLSDTDISNMADSLRGFTTSGLPTAFQSRRSYVKLRANGSGRQPATEFVNHLKGMRDTEIDGRSGGRPTLAVTLQRAAVASAIEADLKDKVAILNAADPTFFGNGSQITPTQALLLYYMVASDDFLMGDQTEVNSTMSGLQSLASNATNSSYPSPAGHRAYGANGYLFSSPVNYLLDDSTVSSFVGAVQARIN